MAAQLLFAVGWAGVSSAPTSVEETAIALVVAIAITAAALRCKPRSKATWDETGEDAAARWVH